MSNSLQQRLSIWLSIAIVATGFLAAGVSFWFAYNEAQEFQDDSLRQIATLADADRVPSDGQRSMGAMDEDPEARIVVQRLAASAVLTRHGLPCLWICPQDFTRLVSEERSGAYMSAP